MKFISSTIDSYGLNLTDMVDPINTQPGREKCRSVQFPPTVVDANGVWEVSRRSIGANLVDFVEL